LGVKVPPFWHNLVQNGVLYKEYVQEKDKGGTLQPRGVGLLLGGKAPLFWHNLVRNDRLFREGEIPFHRSSLRIGHLFPKFPYILHFVQMAKILLLPSGNYAHKPYNTFNSRKCRYSINRTYYYATASPENYTACWPCRCLGELLSRSGATNQLHKARRLLLAAKQ
jgi:hypothetical protein